MTEQDKINNLSRFEHENDLILEVGTQLGILRIAPIPAFGI
jgi:hypothetical protein